MIVFLITGTYLYLGAVNDIFISAHDDGLALLFSSLIISSMAGLFGLESFLLKKKIERMSMK
ncbi:hypothetical protein P5G51_008925 [Virgibacillus sp. 179-BFC.A HS]|uniref:Uncharacterized protein n=1 Tax=Tigheibacillus jepli TaxID=3035914 RepID=A0ABU5CJ27_9BACI|nr:hypothetical protein [Virgibacillus sp. 179-BFC.A HS]MDY0405505.1 hypothetical protein [Virgibacillus sp. 179-BFC.A HS]